MIFNIRQIDQTATGREIVRERVLDQAEVTIGRAAENDIHLPDLAVDQHHVRVVPQTSGQLRFEAIGKLGFALDGKSTQAVTTDGRGAELVLGSFRLDFAAADDGGQAVTIRQMEEREGGAGDGLHGFSLVRALPGKRPIAWAALAAILIAFLAVPIYSHLTRDRTTSERAGPGERSGGVMMDASWSPGALSTAHHGLEDDCEACHVQPFVAVRDDSCLSCHADIGDHADKPELSVARGPMSFGEGIQRRVADWFHKPGPGACTDCHTEHEGAGRMATTSQKFCADCHGSLSDRLAASGLGDAADFGTAHPQFTAAVLTEPGQSQPQRISLTKKPKEFNGLRFPHELHLAKSGGVARMASRIGAKNDYGAALECKDCHRPTADGVRFLPVDMERDCETCHSLVYDRVGDTYRTLRHGDIAQMRADLMAADRSARRPIAPNRRRPGEYAPGGLYHFNAGSNSSSLVTRALSPAGVCGECHYPAAAGPRAGVMPVSQPARYFMHGWFDHDDHKQEVCTSCHAATESDSAGDLLLPGIAQCRTCHMGETATKSEVPSSCAMCHSYHPRDGAPARTGGLALSKR